MNVVLQGVNNTDNPDIYNIGMEIDNKYIKSETLPSTMDNIPSKKVVIENVEVDNPDAVESFFESTEK